MALDQVEVMAARGFERFAFVGHDRGARVTTRPMYNTANRTFYFHWFFLSMPPARTTAPPRASISCMMRRISTRKLRARCLCCGVQRALSDRCMTCWLGGGNVRSMSRGGLCPAIIGYQ